MHFSRRKILFFVFHVMTLLISVALINIPMPVFAQSTELAVDPQITVDPTKSPGTTFSIDITITNVEYMLAFNLFVYYNTTVLTATNHGGYYPFDVKLPSEINDTAGYVSLGYSYPLPEYYGLFWTTPPFPIAWIEFSVDTGGWGKSLLDVRDSVISDVYGVAIPHDEVDGYFANVAPRYDVEVTEVQPNATRDITPGDIVGINVTVANQGPYDAEFNVTTHIDSTTLGPEAVTLAKLRETIVSFEWDTAGAAFGHYTVSAEASVVGNETDTADNTLSFDDVVIVGTHDVAVTGVTATPRSLAAGETLDISVTVANQGNFTETFDVTTTYGGALGTLNPEKLVKTETVPSLDAGNSATLTSALDTSSIVFGTEKGVDIWIKGNVSKTGETAVPYETKTTNNRKKLEFVTVWEDYVRLEAPEVVDPDLAPGQTFSMNITVAKVEKMFAYSFYLYYNNTVLNATSLTSYFNFTEKVSSTINNTEGWVYMNYTAYGGNTSSTVAPEPIAGIEFNVTDWGESPLDIRNPKVKVRIEQAGTVEREVALITVNGSFANILASHDIKVSLEAPTQLYLGDSPQLNVTVHNYGNSTETDVELRLLINGTEEDSIVIPELLSLASYTWSYNWTPTAVGTYNITAYAPPVAGEPEARKANNYPPPVIAKVGLVKPTVSFTFSPQAPFEGEKVTFYAQASSLGSTIVSYEWDFDDDNTTGVTVPTIKHIYTANGTYTVRLTVTDKRGQSSKANKTLTIYRRDVAVLSVTPSANQVVAGKSLTITAVVTNRGDSGYETFNVTVYYDNTTIETKTVEDLAIAANETVNFSWNTTGVSLGTYAIKAVAATVPKEFNTTNNELVSDVSVTVVTRNVAITDIEASTAEVTVGDTVTISVTVLNKGNLTETFNVTVSYDNTAIETKNVTNLSPGASQTLDFSWNTTGVDLEPYSLKGVASSVPDEADETDNTYIGPTVTVKAKPKPESTPTDTTPYIVAAGVALAAVIILVLIWKFRKR